MVCRKFIILENNVRRIDLASMLNLKLLTKGEKKRLQLALVSMASKRCYHGHLAIAMAIWSLYRLYIFLRLFIYLFQTFSTIIENITGWPNVQLHLVNWFMSFNLICWYLNKTLFYWCLGFSWNVIIHLTLQYMLCIYLQTTLKMYSLWLW